MPWEWPADTVQHLISKKSNHWATTSAILRSHAPGGKAREITAPVYSQQTSHLHEGLVAAGTNWKALCHEAKTKQRNTVTLWRPCLDAKSKNQHVPIMRSPSKACTSNKQRCFLVYFKLCRVCPPRKSDKNMKNVNKQLKGFTLHWCVVCFVTETNEKQNNHLSYDSRLILCTFIEVMET